MERGDFVFTKDNKIKAIYSEELSSLLVRLNKLDQFSQGKIKCRYCTQTITEQNLYAIIPAGAEIDMCCNAPECIIALAEEGKK